MDLNQWIARLKDSMMSSAETLIVVLPKLIGAIMLLVLGYVVAKLVGLATTRVMRMLGMDRAFQQSVLSNLLVRSGITKNASQIMGAVVFWIVFLFFLIAAFEVLGLARFSEALTQLALYTPKLAAGVLIVLIGIVGANFLREIVALICTSAGIPQGAAIAQALYLAMLLLVVVTGINHLGIDTSLVNNALMMLMGGLVAGAALSFGLGARSAVSNLIVSHYLRPVLTIGQKVRFGEVSGVIVSVTPISVILETDQGRMVVSASQFAESTPTLLTRED